MMRLVCALRLTAAATDKSTPPHRTAHPWLPALHATRNTPGHANTPRQDTQLEPTSPDKIHPPSAQDTRQRFATHTHSATTEGRGHTSSRASGVLSGEARRPKAQVSATCFGIAETLSGNASQSGPTCATKTPASLPDSLPPQPQQRSQALDRRGCEVWVEEGKWRLRKRHRAGEKATCM
eukprot:3687020-Rhodomonas_salina.1